VLRFVLTVPVKVGAATAGGAPEASVSFHHQPLLTPGQAPVPCIDRPSGWIVPVKLHRVPSLLEMRRPRTWLPWIVSSSTVVTCRPEGSR
jgi:hypothetical protein